MKKSVQTAGAKEATSAGLYAMDNSIGDIPKEMVNSFARLPRGARVRNWHWKWTDVKTIKEFKTRRNDIWNEST